MIKRRLVQGLFGIAWVLIVLFAGLRVRGMFASDRVTWVRVSSEDGKTIYRTIELFADGSELGLTIDTQSFPPPSPRVHPPSGFTYRSDRPHAYQLALARGAFQRFFFLDSGQSSRNERDWAYHEARVPLWLAPTLFLPVALLSGRWIWIARRRLRRARRGECLACAYDLRGGHDRCPECGEPVAAAAPV